MLLACVTFQAALSRPSFSRREVGALGALAGHAGFAGAATPALAVGDKTQPFQTQPGYKLNTGVQFPTASFGLQVYDDRATITCLFSLQ